MSTRTSTHVLRLSYGAIRIDVTEAAEVVYIAQRGPRLRPHDIPRFAAWMRPLLDVYADDPRPLEMSGEHADWTGRVELADGAWRSYGKPIGALQ